MRVEYTGRQMEVTPAIQKFTEDRLKKIKKLLGESIEVHAILTVEKYRHIAEINLKSTSFKLNGLEETNDMYSSINAVLEKIERQALKAKERKIAKKRNSSSGNSGRLVGVIEPSRANPEHPSESYAAKPMTVEEAVLRSPAQKVSFWFFEMQNPTGSVLSIGEKTEILV